MTWQLFSVIPVWAASLIAAIVIGMNSPESERSTWLGITFGAAIIVSFVIQLAIQRKEGFVMRTMASIGGSLVVLAVATGILLLL